MGFKELYCCCPSCGTGNASNWYHPCGSKLKLEIDENGIIRCTGCHQTNHISKEQFYCPNHEGKVPCLKNLVYAMGLMVSGIANDIPWGMQLLLSLCGSHKNAN